MKLTKILKSKRGVAIETSVLFIIVIFSLCSLVTMLSLIQNTQTQIDKTVLKNELELEQITEHFLAFIEENDDLLDPNRETAIESFINNSEVTLNGKYTCEVYNYTLVVKSNEGNELFSMKAGFLKGDAVIVERDHLNIDSEETETALYKCAKGLADIYLSYETDLRDSINNVDGVAYFTWTCSSKSLVLYDSNDTVLRYVQFDENKNIITWLDYIHTTE